VTQIKPPRTCSFSPTEQAPKPQIAERRVVPAASAVLPPWLEAEQAGGRTRWEKWIKNKVASCMKRARKWKRSDGSLPSASEWRQAIRSALWESNGYAHYSRLPLSLSPSTAVSTDWNYPSVDHCISPGIAEVVIETRLVNDMKTIMSPQEFLEVIGHLAATPQVEVKTLPPDWHCDRSFARPQKFHEPALSAPDPEIRRAAGHGLDRAAALRFLDRVDDTGGGSLALADSATPLARRGQSK